MKQNVSAFPEVSARRIQMTKNNTFLKKKHFIWNLIFSFYICGKKQTKHSFMKTTMVNTFFWWRHLQPLRS